MPRFRAAYPPEFRRQMVELVRSGRTPEELSREFEPNAQSIMNWVRQAGRDAGKRTDGLTPLSAGSCSGSVARTSACARSAISCQRRRPGSRERARQTRTGFPVHERATCAAFPIKTMARVFKVSASGYYAWRGRPASARAAANLDLTRRIRTIHEASRSTYGAPRVHAEFKAAGVAIGKKRVARLMQTAGSAQAGAEA